MTAMLGLGQIASLQWWWLLAIALLLVALGVFVGMLWEKGATNDGILNVQQQMQQLQQHVEDLQKASNPRAKQTKKTINSGHFATERQGRWRRQDMLLKAYALGQTPILFSPVFRAMIVPTATEYDYGTTLIAQGSFKNLSTSQQYEPVSLEIWSSICETV